MGSPEAVAQAIERAQRVLWQSQRDDGAWDSAGHVGPWVTAQVVVSLSFMGQLPRDDATEAARWLRGQQRADGSFAIHPFAEQGDLGTTACAWAALHVCDMEGSTDAIARARAYVDRNGGVPKVLGLMEVGDLAAVYLAMAKLVEPHLLPQPFTAPLLIPGVVPLLSRRFHAGVFHMALELDVLTRKLRGELGPGGRGSFVARRACERLVELLRPFQNPDGSWNDSCVLTVLALPALWAAGMSVDDPMLQRGLTWLKSQKVVDMQGLRFDGFGTEVWSTAFNVRALLTTQTPASDPDLTRALAFLTSAQLSTPMPKVDHAKRGPLSGGWAFQRSNITMPDCDDTAVVLTALGRALQATGVDALPADAGVRVKGSAERGREWLLGMQNPDGGWSAFVWGLPGKRRGPTLERRPRVKLENPFAFAALVLSPPASMGDPSTEDVTARVLHGLGQLGYTLASSAEVQRAVAFLHAQQCPSGAWWGRWVVNYLSATAFVLMGLSAVGVDMQSPFVRDAVRFLLSKQNPDGGWGEGPGSYVNERFAGVGESMPPLTGLVLQGLMDAGDGHSAAPQSVERGVAYLLSTQRKDGTWPNGTYLHTNVPPDTFYLYPEAARFYPTEALGKYQGLLRSVPTPLTLTSGRFTSVMMDAKRQVADPVADAVVQRLVGRGSSAAVGAMMANLFRNDDPIPPGLPDEVLRYFEDTSLLPPWADTEKLLLAQQLFTRTGWSVATGLFCSSLPQAYAAARGARVLIRTQGMTRHVRQRVFETAQFLFDVLDEGALAPQGRGIRAAQKVRLMHAGIRHLLQTGGPQPWPAAQEGLPINQEDLAGTLMTFSSVTLDALRVLSVPVSPGESEAWLHTWKVVGHLLGIADELLPSSLSDADDLMDTIRDRQWAPSEEGRALTSALVEMMQSFIPEPPLRGLPSAMIRHLAGDHCADLLGLPRIEWPLLIDHALKLLDPAAGGASEVDLLLQHGLHLLMEGVVLAEREGKQARFRIPTSLRNTVDPRL